MRLRTASCTFARPFACILCFRAAARHIAGDRYQHCIKQDWAKKEGVERCNKEFGQALATAYWSSWAQLAFIPVGLAWFMGWGLSFLVRRVRSGPQAGRKVALPMANDDENAFGSGKKPMTNCGLLGQKPYSRPSLCSLLANFLHASPDIAATLFYRNANARSRNEILSRGDAGYGPFWESAIKRVDGLDRRRNEIVHWHEAIDFFRRWTNSTEFDCRQLLGPWRPIRAVSASRS